MPPDISALQRRGEAVKRAMGAKTHGPFGCLGPIIAAWPAAWADHSCGDLARALKAGGVVDALDMAFGYAARIDPATALPGDVGAVRLGGPMVASIRTGGSFIVNADTGPLHILPGAARLAWRVNLWSRQ